MVLTCKFIFAVSCPFYFEILFKQVDFNIPLPNLVHSSCSCSTYIVLVLALEPTPPNSSLCQTLGLVSSHASQTLEVIEENKDIDLNIQKELMPKDEDVASKS